MSDLRQLPEWGEWLRRTGWSVEKLGLVGGRKTQAFVRKIPLLPLYIVKIQRFEGEIEKMEIEKLRRRYRIIYMVVEPLTDVQCRPWLEAGYGWEKSPFLPAKTRVIDLTRSEKSLWNDLDQNARRILNKKNRVRVTSILAEEFFSGWKKFSPTLILTHWQFKTLNEVLKKKVEYWASVEGGITASAIMMIYSDDGAHYYQTWTSKEGRRNNGQFYLVWDRILDAKKRKKKYFDFEGIYDQRHPLKNWKGFSEFKRKFGGYEVTYPGCLYKWF